MIGVELDKPEGLCNGTVKGVTYFTCPEKHGIFVKPALVEPVFVKVSDRVTARVAVAQSDNNDNVTGAVTATVVDKGEKRADSNNSSSVLLQACLLCFFRNLFPNMEEARSEVPREKSGCTRRTEC